MELRRSACGLFVFLGCALATPASAYAADRFASPADLGTGDCLSEVNSCDLPTAVSGASAGDDIFVRGDQGDYALSAPLTNAAALHYHGTHGRPRLIFSDSSLTLQAGSSADNLYVEMGGTASNVHLSNSTGNNLIAQHTGHDHAIFLQDSTLTNSVAWTPISSGTGEQSIELDKSNTLRNVTAFAPAAGGIAIVAIGRNPPATSGSATDNLVNVIARGGSGGAGIVASEQDDVDFTLNVDHSNFSAVDEDPGNDDTKTHINLTSNQIDEPSFANAANGDFHQVAGSPSIDKGTNSVANGTTDFDGDSRTLNGTTDIGADEFSGSNVTKAPDQNPACQNPAVLLTICNPAGLPDHEFVLPGRAKCLVKRLMQCVIFPQVPGPGTLRVKDIGPGSKADVSGAAKKKRKKRYRARIKPARATAKKAGKVKITLRPTKAGARILRRKRKLKLNLRVTYTPTGGTAKSKTKKVTLRLKKVKRKKKKR